MKEFLKLLRTEFKRIFSNDVMMLIFFGAPIAYGILFGYVYFKAKVTDLPIVIVDYDVSPISDKIIHALDDNEVLKIVEVKHNAHTIKEEMPKNNYAAIISIPKGFEADLLLKRYPEIQVDVNTVNILNANFATKNIQLVLGTLKAGIEINALQKQGLSPTIAQKQFEPFKINYNKLYNPTGNYDMFMLPGLIGAIMQQVIFLALALVFARDFEDGYFSELVQHSKNALYHFMLKAVPFMFLIPPMWLVVGLITRFFCPELSLFVPTNYLLIALLSMAAVSTGTLFSIAIPNRLKATELLMVISTPAFVLSGFTWPRMAMPELIAKAADIIPSTAFLDALKKVVFYESNLKGIMPEIRHLVLLVVVTFILTLIILQVKIHVRRKKLKLE
ncbi:MAG: ABC transporter [Flavobacteriia bacterium]|nr:MAG: ABC transporter [Flavobacteriia bacterium]